MIDHSLESLGRIQIRISTILDYFNWRGVRMQLSKRLSIVWLALALAFSEVPASSQSVASGTIEGTVVDSTGGVVVGATVEITNPLTGYQQTAVTDAMGAFRFTNIPFNPSPTGHADRLRARSTGCECSHDSSDSRKNHALSRRAFGNRAR